MRILLITGMTSLEAPGGLTTHIRHIWNTVGSDHQVDVLHLGSQPRLFEMIRDEVIRRWDRLDPFLYYEVVQTYLELAYLQLDQTYDVVHAHDVIAWNSLADVVPSSVPFLLTVHSPYRITEEMPDLDPSLVEYVEQCQYNAIRHADVLLTVSSWMKAELESQSRRSVLLMENAVDTARFVQAAKDGQRVREQLGVKPQDILLFSPNCMDARKRNHLLIETLRVLSRQGRSKFHLVIAGEGRDRDRLAALSEAYGLTDRVHLIHAIPPEEMPAYYSAADYCLSASDSEGGEPPYVVLEALATGVPFIAADVPGIGTSIEHARTGYLIDRPEPERFAAAILRLETDQELRASLVRGGRAWAMQYSLDAWKYRLLQVYESASAHPRRRVREHSALVSVVSEQVARRCQIPEHRRPLPKKVLLASLDYPRTGGVTSHIRRLMRGLRQSGYVVDVLHPAGFAHTWPVVREVRKHLELGESGHIPSSWQRYWDEQALDLQYAYAWALERGLAWDLIHCHDAVCAARLASVSTVPIILTLHNTIVSEEVAMGNVQPGSAEEAYLQLLEASAMASASAVIAVSTRVRDAIVHAYPDFGIYSVPNWVDTDQFRPLGNKRELRRRFGLPEDEFLILCPSRLDARKGIEYLVAAADRLDGTVVLIATRKDAHAIIERHRKGGKIILIDPVDASRMVELYNAVDVCVLPSVTVNGTAETSSLVALEAVSCEVPLVATDVGGLGEIMHRLGLSPIPQRSADAIVQRIRELRSNWPVVQRECAEARKRLERIYGERDVVRRITLIYENVSARNQPCAVLPYLSPWAHLDQVLLLLRNGRAQEATQVYLARPLSEVDLVTHTRLLARWVSSLEHLGYEDWLTRLQDWIAQIGFSEPVQTDAGQFRREREANPSGRSKDELVHQLRAAEFHARCRRVRECPPQPLAIRAGVPATLHIVYLMAHVEVSGGARVILEHANRLHRRGVRVTIVSHFPRPEWYPVECEYVQVPFHVELAHCIPDCDVIVATYWDQIQACVETGIAPVVYFEQGDFHLFEQLDPQLARLVAMEIGAAAFVTTVSEPAAEILRTRYGREARVFPNAYDAKVFYPAENRATLGRGYMMMMGSDQQAFKGTHEVIKAYRLVRQAGYDLDLVWVSPTPVKNPVGRVIIRPTQAELGELYRNATVFVSGSRYEAFSLPVLEAMASGCPVVATTNAGVTSYARHEHNALLVESGDGRDLAEQVIRVLRDDHLREHLRTMGFLTAKSFSWDRIIDDLVAFYKEVSTYQPRRAGKLENWELLVSDGDHLSPDGPVKLRKLLTSTHATSVQVPVVYDMFEGHQVARWETVARRRQGPDTAPLRVYIPVRGSDARVPYTAALECFRAGEYEQALKLFSEHYGSSSSIREKEMFIRWICLCLLELERDDQARNLLSDALQLFPANSDLLYLYAMARLFSGRYDGVQQLFETILALGDCASAEEFFHNLWGTIQRHLAST